MELNEIETAVLPYPLHLFEIVIDKNAHLYDFRRQTGNNRPRLFRRDVARAGRIKDKSKGVSAAGGGKKGGFFIGNPADLDLRHGIASVPASSINFRPGSEASINASPMRKARMPSFIRISTSFLSLIPLSLIKVLPAGTKGASSIVVLISVVKVFRSLLLMPMISSLAARAFSSSSRE